MPLRDLGWGGDFPSLYLSPARRWSIHKTDGQNYPGWFVIHLAGKDVSTLLDSSPATTVEARIVPWCLGLDLDLVLEVAKSLARHYEQYAFVWAVRDGSP